MSFASRACQSDLWSLRCQYSFRGGSWPYQDVPQYKIKAWKTRGNPDDDLIKFKKKKEKKAAVILLILDIKAGC